MIAVTNFVTVVEKNYTPAYSSEPIKVLSHSGLVNSISLEIDKQVYSVSADDLITAILNALNTGEGGK